MPLLALRARSGMRYTLDMVHFSLPTRRGNGILILVILIALAIALYLMFGNMGGGKAYMGEVKRTKDRGQEMAREIQVGQMSMLIAMYRESNKKLPKEPADMESPGAFNDPWGKEMTLSFEEKNGKTVVTYHSAGPDGEVKTEDDKRYTDTLPY